MTDRADLDSAPVVIGNRTSAETGADRTVVLVRYRSGVVGETRRTVHVVELSAHCPEGVVGAECGAVLTLDHLEVVGPGEGMPCLRCVLTHTTPSMLATEEFSVSHRRVDAVDGADYQSWGWPVTCHRDQIRLVMAHDLSAWAIPVQLCVEMMRILAQRRCAPAVLAHPYATAHRIVITGEPYGVPLPWPAQVHRITGVLRLPPTLTSRGSITWAQPPQADSLSACREIDLFGALRTALSDFPSESPPVGR